MENYDCRTKFNSSFGMEYNAELYGFSAVKVKTIDSQLNSSTEADDKIDLTPVRVFILNNSFSKFPFFY